MSTLFIALMATWLSIAPTYFNMGMILTFDTAILHLEQR